MNLSEVDFYMDWPVSIEVKNLRKHVMANLVKRGDVIRWSIIDIQNSIDSCAKTRLRVKAVLAN